MSAILTDGYHVIRTEFLAEFDEGDKYGSSVEWQFAIAETLFHHGYELPQEWEFSDSPMHSGDDYEWYYDTDYSAMYLTELLECEKITETDLVTFGHVLFRYIGILREAGLDY